jgi:hypothetical protein
MRSLWSKLRDALNRVRIARYRYKEIGRDLGDERAQAHVEQLCDGSHDYMGRAGGAAP